MQVEPLRPEDAEELVRLSLEWEQGMPIISPGAHGAVVRENGSVQAWALLRETSHGFVIDEIWAKHSRIGRLALGTIARWIESTVAGIAADRGEPALQLGGICRLDNPRHYAALQKRGYEVVAHVFAKDIPARKVVAA